MLTRKQAAIIGAYTGVVVGSMEDLYKYAEELTGHKIECDTQLIMEADKIEKLSHKDFLEICNFEIADRWE